MQYVSANIYLCYCYSTVHTVNNFVNGNCVAGKMHFYVHHVVDHKEMSLTHVIFLFYNVAVSKKYITAV